MKRLLVLLFVLDTFLYVGANAHAQCTFADSKVLSPSLVAVRCKQGDVSGLRGTGAIANANRPSSTLPATISPYPGNKSWFLIDLAASPLVAPNKYKLTLDFGPNGVTPVDIDTQAQFKVAPTTQASKTRLTFTNGALVTANGSCVLKMHDAFGKDGTIFPLSACAAPSIGTDLKNISDLSDVGVVYVTIKATPKWLMWPISLDGFIDPFGKPPGIDKTATIGATTAPSSKDASSYYINFNVLAATGASPSGVLDAKISPPIGQLVAGFQFAPLIKASVGQGKIASQSYSDTIDFGATATRIFLPKHVLDGAEMSPGLNYETDREWDRRNLLGVFDLVLHPPHCYNTQVRRQEADFERFRVANPGTTSTIAGVPPHVFGYSCDIHLFTEDGAALTDTNVTASKGKAVMELPKYDIARIGAKFHTVLQVKGASLDALVTGRYLIATENSVLERKDNSLYLEHFTGWKALFVLTGAYKIDAAGHFSFSVTYTDGFDAPKFNRVNSVTSGLLLKY